MRDRGGLQRGLQWLGAALCVTVAHLWLVRLLIRCRTTPHSRDDFSWIYMAGRSWLTGHSPYDLDSLVHLRLIQDWGGAPPAFWTTQEKLLPFVYPPHWVVIAVPSALLAWPVVPMMWDIVNYVSFLVVCAACWHLAVKRVPTLSRPLLLGALGLCAANGGARWSFADGQMDLLPLVGVAGVVFAHRAKATGWLALFGFFAALKPQIGVYPLLFVLLRGGWKGVSLSALAIGIVSILALAPSGLSVFPAQAAESLRAHASQPFNAPSEFFNAATLLSAFSAGNWPMLVSPLMGMVCVVVLARVNRYLSSEPLGDPLWQLGILCALNVAFFPQHGYGFIIYTPVIILALQFKPRWLGGCTLALALFASRTRALEGTTRQLLAPLICFSVVASCIIALELATRALVRPDDVAPSETLRTA